MRETANFIGGACDNYAPHNAQYTLSVQYTHTARSKEPPQTTKDQLRQAYGLAHDPSGVHWSDALSATLLDELGVRSFRSPCWVEGTKDMYANEAESATTLCEFRKSTRQQGWCALAVIGLFGVFRG